MNYRQEHPEVTDFSVFGLWLASILKTLTFFSVGLIWSNFLSQWYEFTSCKVPICSRWRLMRHAPVVSAQLHAELQINILLNLNQSNFLHRQINQTSNWSKKSRSILCNAMHFLLTCLNVFICLLCLMIDLHFYCSVSSKQPWENT